MRWPLEITEPWMLLLLPLAILLWRWQRGSPAPLSPRRRWWSAMLRTGIFLLVCFALSDPRWFGWTKNVHVMWMADVSRSVGETAFAKAKEFSTKAGSPPVGSSESWMVFAGDARPARTLEAAQKISPKSLRDDDTNLAKAMQFGEATFPRDRVKTAVLFSDGVETEGRLSEQLSTLKNAGVRVLTVPVPVSDKPEVLVRSVEAPAEVNEGEPFRMRATIVSNHDGEADVDVFRNGVRVGTRHVTLKKGSNRFESTQTAPQDKVIELAVGVRSNQDTQAGNNLASTQTMASGMAKVLLIADKPEQARFFARALQSESIQIDVRPITGIPTDLGELQNYDLLILDNVPAPDLSMKQMELIAAYVRDFGGGFLMFGGENAFGLGGYSRTPIEDVLPVRCDFEKEKETPSLAMAIVIDRSGSMSGEKLEMAKTAARSAVELLSPQDYAGVVIFDDQASWAADLQSAASKQTIIDRIASIESSGGTNIAPGLELALQALRTSPAKLKHVILLTDGVSSPGPFQELVSQMAQERITASTVAVGADADQQLLQQIAQWGGGRYYFTDSPDRIPQIFARETMVASKSAIQEMPFVPVPAGSADFLSGIDFKTAPFLLGYVTTRVKPTSDLWLLTEKGEPLLVTWRYGLGQVCAFTSDARNRWAVEWLRWEGFGKFWAQLVRRVMRSASVRRLPAELVRERGGFRIQVDAADVRGGFIEGADGRAIVVGPDGKSQQVKLEQSGPGRLEGWWPASAKGAYHVQLHVDAGGEPVASQYLSATIGYPDELLLLPTDETALRSLAESNGGIFNPKPSDVFSAAGATAAAEHELWPWLIALATLLFIADVGVRRLNFSP
jgi:Ca-activated chloride channel family protein